MNTMTPPPTAVPNASYEATRFNALQHGVLSRYAVLPWEDRREYQALLDALVAEHAPQGPTEEHLVEELAGIIWRKRRLQLAEAAMYRERLRKDATSTYDPEHVAGAALLPLIGKHKVKADIPQALSATPADTARDLRDVKRDQAHDLQGAEHPRRRGTGRLCPRPGSGCGRTSAHTGWNAWRTRPTDDLHYVPTAEALKAWVRRHWDEWYDEPIAELEHRDAIREQAFGSAYATQRLEVDGPIRSPPRPQAGANARHADPVKGASADHRRRGDPFGRTGAVASKDRDSWSRRMR